MNAVAIAVHGTEDTLTMVPCPRCVGGIDPEYGTTYVTRCCERGGVGGECEGIGCVGPHQEAAPELLACQLCNGRGVVEQTEAFEYCLVVE